MRRKLVIFTLILATAVIAVPADSYASTRDSSKDRVAVYENGSQQWRWDRRGRGRGKHKGWKHARKRSRHYSPYRNTYYGNRRYRLVRRYYWDDGRRYTRLVRLYY
jgi:hypothetical protein